MAFPKRKQNRLPDFDYSTPGAYFITVCLKGKKKLLWQTVGGSIAPPPAPRLSAIGKIVERAIQNIPNHYPVVSVDNYAVMPNHIHLLLQIHTDEHGRAMLAPTISVVVQQFKGIVTKQLGYSIWQKLFHDHIIRGEQDYQKIWQYIDGNPSKWEEDCFYVP